MDVTVAWNTYRRIMLTIHCISYIHGLTILNLKQTSKTKTKCHIFALLRRTLRRYLPTLDMLSRSPRCRICMLVGRKHGRGDLHRVDTPTGLILGQVAVHKVLESTPGPAEVLLGWPAVAPPSPNGP